MAQIQQSLPTLNLTGTDFSIGLSSLTTQLKGNFNERGKLRAILEPRTRNLIESVNKDIIEPAIAQLKTQGKKGLVVVIDNLDRIDNTEKNNKIQPEYLFVDRGEQLRKINCHVIYSIPLILTFSNQLQQLQSRFGNNVNVLPMVKFKTRDGKPFEEGIYLLQQMVLARAFPDLGEKERINYTNQIFDFPQTFERLCLMSGGHVRNLLVLLFSCLQQEDPPISIECLNDVIQRQRDMLKRAITDDEWESLEKVKNSKSVSGEDEYTTLLSSLFVFEYEDQEGLWFDINPLLIKTEVPELQEDFSVLVESGIGDIDSTIIQGLKTIYQHYEDYLDKKQYNLVADTAEKAYKMLQEVIQKVDKSKDRELYLRLAALSSYWKLNRDLYVSRSSLDGN